MALDAVETANGEFDPMASLGWSDYSLSQPYEGDTKNNKVKRSPYNW